MGTSRSAVWHHHRLVCAVRNHFHRKFYDCNSWSCICKRGSGVLHYDLLYPDLSSALRCPEPILGRRQASWIRDYCRFCTRTFRAHCWIAYCSDRYSGNDALPGCADLWDRGCPCPDGLACRSFIGGGFSAIIVEHLCRWITCASSHGYHQNDYACNSLPGCLDRYPSEVRGTGTHFCSRPSEGDERSKDIF